ncbi:MAG: lysine transporter LysE [Rhodobacteraceae bacterium]|nr:MAG: lysine transporter LysE [Paracoccaceae bacterium]
MSDLGTLATVGLAFWVVAASPGPANISNATIAMRYGRKSSLIYGVGLSVALAFWGVVAAAGLGAVLQASIGLLIALKVFGGGYLLWLAWQSARSAASPKPRKVINAPSGNWFLRGLILNLSNPKSVIAWMAALSVGLDPSATTTFVLTATMLCVVVAFANNAIYSLAFSTRGMMGAYERSRRWVDGVVAGLFAAAGVGLLRSALAR